MKSFSSELIERTPEGFSPIPKEDFSCTVVEYFEAAVERFSQKTAIVSNNGEISYRNFNEVTNQCARSILNLMGDIRREPILFLADFSIDCIITIMGILKSGNIYVALDASNPVERLKAIIEDSGSHLIITTSRYHDIAETLAQSGLMILNLDDLDKSLPKENIVPRRSKSQDPAVIFYTSGSTGKPKGVLLDHRAIMERISTKINSEKIYHEDRLLLPFPVGFGWSTQSVFGSLIIGATLYIRSYNESSLSDLHEWLELNKITNMPASSSFFRQFLASLPDEGKGLFPAMRNITTSGEVLHPVDIRDWQKHFTENTTLVYGLSSTEAGAITKNRYTIKSNVNQDNITFGSLFDSMKLFILDENNVPVTNGNIGQIGVQGSVILKGYWRKPELNQRIFINNPEDPDKKIFLTGDLGRIRTDGTLEFLGRKDTQIKIRGFRIDTSEVETAFLKHPAVKNVFVTGFTDNGNLPEPLLIAYISHGKQNAPSETELKTFATENLPDYMVPSRIIILDELPLNSNGKVDRKALPVLDSLRRTNGTNFVAPRTELERKICEVWQDILKIDVIGIHDDFFESGGDSLIFLQMIIRIEKLVGQKISNKFLETPTISNLVSELNAPSLEGSQTNGKISENSRVMSRINQRESSRTRKSVGFRKKLRQLESTLTILPFLHILNKSYPDGILWLLRSYSHSRVFRFLYGYQYKLLENFLEDMGCSRENAARIMPASFAGNVLINLYARTVDDDETIQSSKRMEESPYLFWNSLVKVIHETPLDQLDQFFSLSGQNHLEQAIEKKKGVILVTYHTTAGRFASQALSRRMGIKRITTITQKVALQQGSKRKELNSPHRTSKRPDSVLFAIEALKGQHLLMEGSVIQLVGDIETYDFQNSKNIANRKYTFKTGFAELAVNTGAVVLPLYSALQPDGHIHTTILPPLDPGSGDHDSMVNTLMDGYVSFLNMAWAEAPQSLRWTRYRTHLKKPRFK